MSECYLGEIRIFAGNYAPMDWELCDGRPMPIMEYQALYALIGTIYGGDGVNTFNLPDLRGRLPLHIGQGPGLTPRTIGSAFGTEREVLGLTQIPAHTHNINVGADSSSSSPGGNYLGNSKDFLLYTTAATGDGTMAPAAVGNSGGSGSSHDNMMPSLCLNYIIALNGYFPTPP